MICFSNKFASINATEKISLSPKNIELFKSSTEFLKARQIIQILESEGYLCLFVGGCVRDTLLGTTPDDLDLATNCHLDELVKIFKKYKVNVSIQGEEYSVANIFGLEVATLRVDTDFHGDGINDVEYTNNVVDDSKRRDLTINSLYMDIDFTIYDYCGGLSDINNRLIRTVGDAKERFNEHSTRLLRAIYFKNRFEGFNYGEGLIDIMKENTSICNLVVNEMYGKMLEKVIKHNCLSGFMKDCMEIGVMDYGFKEISHLKDLKQNPKFHCFDAWNHTLEVVKTAEKIRPGDVAFILGALYHDVGKGLPGIRGFNKEGAPNDLGHEEAGSPIAYNHILRYGFGKEIATEASFYVKHHGISIKLKSAKKHAYLRWVRVISREFKNRKELTTVLEKLVDIIYCDTMGFGEELKNENLSRLPLIKASFKLILSENILFLKELPINGNDVMSITGCKGKDVGEILNEFLIMNINDRARALKILENRKGK